MPRRFEATKRRGLARPGRTLEASSGSSHQRRRRAGHSVLARDQPAASIRLKYWQEDRPRDLRAGVCQVLGVAVPRYLGTPTGTAFRVTQCTRRIQDSNRSLGVARRNAFEQEPLARPSALLRASSYAAKGRRTRILGVGDERIKGSITWRVDDQPNSHGA